MEKGHYGQYTGNARHSRTPVTRENYKASERDDAAHIDYLKRDIKYDAKHGGSDKQMTNDEKHISKLAGDMKYDKKHHSPLNNTGKPKPTVDEFGTPIPAGFVADMETPALTPDVQYTRDLGIDQGTPGTADYIPGTRYYAENMRPGSINHRLKHRPGYRQSFSNPSGDLNAYPTNPFITRDYNEFGDEISRDSELGKIGYNGMIGRSFSQEDVNEMQARHDRYMAPKKKSRRIF